VADGTDSQGIDTARKRPPDWSCGGEDEPGLVAI